MAPPRLPTLRLTKGPLLVWCCALCMPCTHPTHRFNTYKSVSYLHRKWSRGGCEGRRLWLRERDLPSLLWLFVFRLGSCGLRVPVLDPGSHCLLQDVQCLGEQPARCQGQSCWSHTVEEAGDEHPRVEQSQEQMFGMREHLYRQGKGGIDSRKGKH